MWFSCARDVGLSYLRLVCWLSCLWGDFSGSVSGRCCPFVVFSGGLLASCIALFLVLGDVLSVVRVSGGLAAPSIVIGCCWAIALFGNKFLLIQKKIYT